ncbi:hypothetical protein [Ornithinibacillus contaminans]|uniref:hypothetical protein n=1 Tax=Ornithinibacillus contaminans TaxID=694055 RepID=UPI00069F28F8|nr:hypothetical protein [Ornithinibacillus contaminans]
MIEVLTERNKGVYFDYFRINEKKFFSNRLLMAIMFLAIYLLLIYSFNNWYLLIGIPFSMLIGFKLPYLKLISMKNKDDIIKQYAFPTFLRYFIALVGVKGNVYQTLKAVIPYVNAPIQAELEKLVNNLDKNNVSNRDAYMLFADFIGSSEARMIVEMIYQFDEEGINKEELRELENTIEQLQENKTNELIDYKVSTMEIHANPIILYTILYVLGFTVLVFIAYLSELLL